MSLSPLLANPRENLGAVQLEEARLTVAGRMEDQVVEAKIEIRPQLFDVLVRVAGDEPSPVSDILHGFGQPLHLSRVVDARLRLSGKRESSPDLSVLHRLFPVGVE